MAILRGIDGKFYDVPDDQLASFEVPRDKVKELLAKAGGPAPQGGPGAGPKGGHGPSHGGSVIVQIFSGGSHGPAGAPGGGQHHAEGGEVDPYGWYWNNWGNFWPNWGNY